jgi:hypothetical protein
MPVEDGAKVRCHACSNTKVGVGRVVKMLLDVVKRSGNPKAQDLSLFVVQRLQEGPEPQMSSLAPFKPSHREVYKDPPESEMCMEY